MDSSQQVPLSSDEPVTAGPFFYFSDSMMVEFLQPHPSRNASFLVRTTFKHDHPLNQTGKKHPFCPPLHLHFEQMESLEVLSGKLGATTGWDATDTIWTPEDGSHLIPTWVPHCFFPVMNEGEDSVVLAWAHPDGTPHSMDRMFFQTLWGQISDVSEKKASLDPFQLMLSQHATATALVWLPTYTWLGPLRWWVPLKIQAIFAYIAGLMGKTPIMKQYVSPEDWQEAQGGKVKLK